MKKLENELANLRQRVVEMGNRTESMVAMAIDFISEPQNRQLYDRVLKEEDALDQMQLKIDEEAVRLLTVYSPVAGDLRFILSVSRINTELERIGDHATNMCEGVELMVSKTETPPMPELQRMAQVVRGMVGEALDAFLQNDSRKAQATIASDDMVDALNDQIIGELLSHQVVREVLINEKNIAGALAQILIARSLERIADQCTNISEEIVYMVKGHDIRHQAD